MTLKLDICDCLGATCMCIKYGSSDHASIGVMFMEGVIWAY